MHLCNIHACMHAFVHFQFMQQECMHPCFYATCMHPCMIACICLCACTQTDTHTHMHACLNIRHMPYVTYGICRLSDTYGICRMSDRCTYTHACMSGYAAYDPKLESLNPQLNLQSDPRNTRATILSSTLNPRTTLHSKS